MFPDGWQPTLRSAAWLNLETAVDRCVGGCNIMIIIKCFINFTLTLLVRGRYGADCTVLRAQGGVANRCNGTTIAPRRALHPPLPHTPPRPTAVSRLNRSRLRASWRFLREPTQPPSPVSVPQWIAAGWPRYPGICTVGSGASARRVRTAHADCRVWCFPLSYGNITGIARTDGE